jgi:hypothetical protein
MAERKKYSIELNLSQHAFLQEMVRQFALPDVDKALRALINFAREQGDQQEAIFSEIRCLDC